MTGAGGNIVDKNQLVFRLNRIIQAIEARTGLDDLDFASKAMLSFIADAEFDRKLLRISDVVKVPAFGTAPTVFSRLSQLEKSGWIRYSDDPNDKRVKLLGLTPASRRAYQKMSLELSKLLEQV